jgi:hypothetical protein
LGARHGSEREMKRHHDHCAPEREMHEYFGPAETTRLDPEGVNVRQNAAVLVVVIVREEALNLGAAAALLLLLFLKLDSARNQYIYIYT